MTGRRIALAAAGMPGEEELVRASKDCGVVVVRRCIDAVDLMGALSADPGLTAVVAASLPRLTPDVVERLQSIGVPLVGLVSDAGADADLRALGVALRIDASGSAAQTWASVASVAAAGVMSTGVWNAPAATEPAIEPAASSGGRTAAGRIVVVWGPQGAPGRTTIAIGIADACADRGLRACIVDADTYAPSVALDLGLLDDVSSLVIACRHADNGMLDAATVAQCALPVRPGLVALTGIQQPDRWPDLRAGALDRVWEACRGAFDVTVVDIGFCLERDDDTVLGRRRNAAALSALAAADHLVAVASAAPGGVARLTSAWPLLGWGREGACTLVRNRTERRDGLAGQWRAAARECGVSLEPWEVPHDPRVLTRAWRRGRTLTETAPRSRIHRALAALAERATMDTGR